MAEHQDERPVDTGTPLDDDRRKFLAACGKFAVVTPPAMTVLLSTSLNSKAIAHSGGRGDPDPGGPGRGSDPGGWLEKLLGELF
jgi:hypothetical protein